MDTSIAETIKNQLGPMSLCMLGAKNLVAMKDGLRFRVGRNGKSVNLLEITLDPSDTYTVRAYWATTKKVTLREESNDVYVESLHEVIETLTGMYTKF